MTHRKGEDLQAYMARANVGSGAHFKVYLPIPKPSQVMVDRDFPDESERSGRKAVCRRCHLVMVDCEPATRAGEFYHRGAQHQTRARRCRNDGQQFCTEDKEIVPFLRKARRRYLKRAGIHP